MAAAVEVNLKAGGGQLEAHVYEGYWAAATEADHAATSNGFPDRSGQQRNEDRRQDLQAVADGKVITPFPRHSNIVYLLLLRRRSEPLVALNSTILAVAARAHVVQPKTLVLADGLFRI